VCDKNPLSIGPRPETGRWLQGAKSQAARPCKYVTTYTVANRSSERAGNPTPALVETVAPPHPHDDPSEVAEI
jgi:hypothetical protein